MNEEEKRIPRDSVRKVLEKALGGKLGIVLTRLLDILYPDVRAYTEGSWAKAVKRVAEKAIVIRANMIQGSGNNGDWTAMALEGWHPPISKQGHHGTPGPAMAIIVPLEEEK